MKTFFPKTGQPIAVDMQNPLGEGGEAVVFDIGSSRVLKIYRQPDDPFFEVPGDPDTTKRNREGAKRRITIHQKKLPAFPAGVPAKVVGPSELVWDKAPQGGKPQGSVVGYIMPFVSGNVMAEFADIDWREKQGIDNNQVRDIFLDWIRTLEQCHQSGLVLGDINPQNQIVSPKGEVFIIDADSAQWQGFLSETFTVRFVDPLICKPNELIMAKPHSRESDLYAFDVIFWLTTLFIGPWEGALPLKTKDPKAQGVRPTERALKRISAMHPEVRYPAWATHFSCLPDDMLHHYVKLLHEDKRGESLRKLLENLRWTNCSACGFYHARQQCPKCAAPTKPEFQVAKITSKLEIQRVLDLSGSKLLAVTIEGGKLCYLYHKDGEYFREFGPIGLKRNIERDLEVAFSGDRSVLSMNGRSALFSPGQSPSLLNAERYRGKQPQVVGNSKHFYYLRGGQLIRDSLSSQGDYIDGTLVNQTQIWVGEEFGVAFYFVSGLQKLKVFQAEDAGSVPVNNMPPLTGTLLNATCYFSKSRAWFFTTTEENGRIYNSCFVIKPNGECSSSLKVEQGDPDNAWLSGFIHLGKCAARLRAGSQTLECLLAATDDGVVGIMDNKGKLVEIMKFDGTAGEVLPTDRLLYDDVLYRIRGSQIHTVRSK